MKDYNNRFIHFLGANTMKAAGSKGESDRGISLTSDINIHDELDRSDLEVIDQYESRLENSDYGAVWSFSNPTYPMAGVDAKYRDSDMKVWMIKCGHCGHHQWMDWVKLGEAEGILDHCLIDVVNKNFICGKCKKHLSDEDRLRGEWVARQGSEVSGYWMSQMNYIKHSCGSLLEKEEKRGKAVFNNFSLGLPYRGTDTSVDRKTILQNLAPGENIDGDFAMGVDNGVWKHYTIGNGKGIVKVGKTKDWGEIEYLFNQYSATMVIDPNPYPNIPKSLVEKYPGRVFLAYYKHLKDSISSVDFLSGRRRRVVYIQRTNYFDALVDKFVNKSKVINLTEHSLEEYIRHWETMSRMELTDGKGITRGEWVSINGNDHYAHATLYQDVALELVGRRKGSRVQESKIENLETKSWVDLSKEKKMKDIEAVFQKSIDKMSRSSDTFAVRPRDMI